MYEQRICEVFSDIICRNPDISTEMAFAMTIDELSEEDIFVDEGDIAIALAEEGEYYE